MTEPSENGAPGVVVSVVIPTLGRDTRLAFALDALAQQTVGTDEFEVLVVRADEAPTLVARSDAMRVRTIADPSLKAVSAKRNAGWRAASGRIVAFTDDDCRPRPDWLERLLAVQGGDPGLIVQGRTEPDPDELHLLHGLARSQQVARASGWYETCNIAYPRELIERTGGFDEGFFWGGEDTDLALRALECGARSAFVPDAVVWHAVRPQPLPAALRGAAARACQPAVISRHPGQRRNLNQGLFSERTHAPLLLAIGGLALMKGRPVLGALATVPYLRLHYDHRRGWIRGAIRMGTHLPGKALVDLTEVAAVCRASIRHRTPVL